ncbi:MAG: PAS domain S-box protein [Desulfomonile tiedjei]|uniref:PAS domain S-box protein n=1 Tax=Desulfomonile tiedjei TaxID=2358 RepID=A0A9D6V7B1_9BACT|nr:PAS domain S-box protein [Desulfomonile tiedjei]
MDKQTYQELERRVQELAGTESKLRELENTYRCLEECLAEAQVMCDLGSNASNMNSTFEQVFDSKVEEIQGRTIPDIAREEKALTTGSIRAALAGKAKPLMTRRFTKDGEALDVTITGARFYDSERNAAGLIAILRNVTGTHDLEAASKKGLGKSLSRRQYQKLFQRHSEGLAIVDFKGTCFQINSRLASIVGLKGRDIHSLREWRQIEQLKQLFDNPFLWKLTHRHGRIRNYETPYIKPDGTQIWLLMHGSLLKTDSDGNRTMMLSVADVTRRKRNAEQADRSSRLLTAYCACLENELTERIRDVEVSRNDLAKHILNLEKVNDAMRTMMTRVQEQKKELQTRIHHNLSLTVLPLIEYLREAKMPESGAHMLDVLEFNIHHITSQFGVKILNHHVKLSPREIQICHMMRAGKDSREIAESLGLTYETVIVHRKNIRKKLGLNRKRQNLAGYIKEHM